MLGLYKVDNITNNELFDIMFGEIFFRTFRNKQISKLFKTNCWMRLKVLYFLNMQYNTD